jgi:hypothetical protein
MPSGSQWTIRVAKPDMCFLRGFYLSDYRIYQEWLASKAKHFKPRRVRHSEFDSPSFSLNERFSHEDAGSCFSVYASCGAICTAGDTPAPSAEVLNLVRLIAAPEQYDGKAVFVVGFLRLEFEGNGLYLHEEDYECGISKNAVWVVRNAKINGRADALNMHYVMLAGTFEAGHDGHMGLFSGSLKNIASATPWPPRIQKRNHSPD